MSVNRYLPAARTIAQAIPGILAQFGLEPLISRFILTETERGAAWLIVEFAVSPGEHLDDYAASGVVHSLSTALRGHPVVINNSDGLRFAVLLGSPNLAISKKDIFEGKSKEMHGEIAE
jgi:hypothetical protein